MDSKFLSNRLGEIRYNNYGSEMKIIRYGGTFDIDVEFKNGYISKNRQYKKFKNGTIKNYNDKTVYNIGYLGDGNYEPRIDGEITKVYDTWKGMLRRCYDKKKQKEFPTYKNCTVETEWLNFQVFGKWFNENFYTVGNEIIALDKDILVKGNKVYSPQTCIFVPEKINGLFVKSNKSRGKFPIGVTWHKTSNKYRAACRDNIINAGSKKTSCGYIGQYATPEEAFYHYKTRKEQVIKEVADKYKEQIPKKLYDAMYKYEVEITD
ncbi:hypothetical protein [Clostridium sp.]|uniref:hypothetical protein n=1 Tax=Clostridium sp. TaxID=1506 RepID=UPI001A571432|nr:hypothetical protein [Clostridium sp.]MBK5242153.1 hypothetical protein [Clostridium sp.]